MPKPVKKPLAAISRRPKVPTPPPVRPSPTKGRKQALAKPPVAPAAPRKPVAHAKPTKTAPQAAKSSSKVPVQPPVAPNLAKGRKQALAKPPVAPAVDPFDVTPTPAIPGVYTGRYEQEGNHAFIAFRRSEYKVTALLMGQPIKVVELPAEVFDVDMQRTKLDGGLYPLQRAVDIFLKSNNGWTDKALRILKRLKAGRDVDEEDTLEDLLDVTPTKPHPMARVRRQAASSEDRKKHRKTNRQAKLAKMNPAELAAWRKKRKERRQARKDAKKGVKP